MFASVAPAAAAVAVAPTSEEECQACRGKHRSHTCSKKSFLKIMFGMFFAKNKIICFYSISTKKYTIEAKERRPKAKIKIKMCIILCQSMCSLSIWAGPGPGPQIIRINKYYLLCRKRFFSQQG